MDQADLQPREGPGRSGLAHPPVKSISIVAGDNVHPASLPNAQTGDTSLCPSSARDSLGQFFRLGFVLLEELWRQARGSSERLFDRATWERIDDGEVRVVRASFAVSPGPRCSEFLKGLAVLFGQTIACGRGRRRPRAAAGPGVREAALRRAGFSEVTGVTVIKRQGKKPSLSAVFFNRGAAAASDAAAQGRRS